MNKPLPYSRVTGEEVQYLNPFRPHKKGPILSKDGSTWGMRYDKETGYFTNGSYLVKLDKPPKSKHKFRDFTELPKIMPKRLGNWTKLLAFHSA